MTGFIYVTIDNRRVRYSVWVNEELRTAIVNKGRGNMVACPINSDNQVYFEGKYYTIFDK